MSFSENLKTLRKMTEMSQEQLAEKLEVSRQAVSKWETEEAYPETEKILSICKMFNCSMDELMQGKITTQDDSILIKNQYDELMNKFSKAIALGVGIVLFGLSVQLSFSELGAIFTSNYNIYETIGTVCMLTIVMIAVGIFIYYGMQMDGFKKKFPALPQLYTQAEEEAFNKKFIVGIIVGVCITMIGVIQLILFDEIGIFRPDSDIPVITLILLVAISAPIFTYFGIQKGKYNVEDYNKEIKAEKEGDNTVTGRSSSVIMLIATAIFLICGFIYNLWHIAWVVFPIGGIMCAIVAVIFNDK